MKITPQSQQYGLPSRTAGELPDPFEFADLLKGSGITAGLMSWRDGESSWDDE